MPATQAQIKRAIAAARASGVSRVQVAPDGVITLDLAAGYETTSKVAEWFEGRTHGNVTPPATNPSGRPPGRK